MAVELSKELHKAFKAWCVDNDTTMRNEIIDFIKVRLKKSQRKLNDENSL